ncbi:MAG TPA: hypothetical protein VII49_04080 [Rhizomicrobium sp.]
MKNEEYRSVAFSIPNNDDGMWRWIIHPRNIKSAAGHNALPRPTYATRDEAVSAAKRAIDALLG